MKKRTCVPFYGNAEQYLERQAERAARSGQHAHAAALYDEVKDRIHTKRARAKS